MRRNDSSELADFCGGYLGYDDRSRHALETALSSLRFKSRRRILF
jgi:hypothetical protein